MLARDGRAISVFARFAGFLIETGTTPPYHFLFASHVRSFGETILSLQSRAALKTSRQDAARVDGILLSSGTLFENLAMLSHGITRPQSARFCL